MTKKERPSLAEYAAAQRVAGVECWLCSIPERAEVEHAVTAGLSTKTAAWRWLRDECGYGDKATANKVQGHFASSHHERQNGQKTAR